MDCPEVAELIDGYALGAADKAEKVAIEAHVADCVRCWEELSAAQQAVAALALSVPISDAPKHLRDRILRKAEREWSVSTPVGLMRRLHLSRPWLAPVASVAAGLFVLFGVFELQMSSMRDDNDSLREQLASAHTDVAQLKQVNAVLAAGDATGLSLIALPAGTTAAGVCMYHWSSVQRLGFLDCSNLESLAAGETYQAWMAEDYQSTSLGTCSAPAGRCQFAVDLREILRRPDGIGMSVEPEGGSPQPTSNWIMYAEFKQ